MARNVRAAESADQPESAATAGSLRKREKGVTIKSTIDVPHGLAFRVAGLAVNLKMTKSALMVKLIDQGCAGYKIDRALRSAWAETQGQDVSAA